MVYKTNVKDKVVGLRWRYPDISNLDGFIISVDDGSFIADEKNVTVVPPNKCSAWPEYFCHTFYDLSFSTNSTFKVRILDNKIEQFQYINKCIAHIV